MEKHIIDKLVKFGLITNIGVDASKYKDVDDLIAKGIVTIPGAKDKIAELLGDDLNIEPDELFTYVDDEQIPQPTIVNEVINEVINEVLDDNSPVIDETPESAPVIDETPETMEPIVDTPADVEPIDENPETMEPEIVVEEVNDEVSETVEEPVKKTRKSKKTE